MCHLASLYTKPWFIFWYWKEVDRMNDNIRVWLIDKSIYVFCIFSDIIVHFVAKPDSFSIFSYFGNHVQNRNAM